MPSERSQIQKCPLNDCPYSLASWTNSPCKASHWKFLAAGDVLFLDLSAGFIDVLTS